MESCVMGKCEVNLNYQSIAVLCLGQQGYCCTVCDRRPSFLNYQSIAVLCNQCSILYFFTLSIGVLSE